MLDASLLRILRCPETSQPLRPATDAEKSAHEIDLSEAALASEDGSRVYRAISGLPLLLPPAKEVASAE